MNNAIASQPQPTNTVKAILSEHILADGFDFVMDIEKSHGSWIHDKVSGQRLPRYVFHVRLGVHRLQPSVSAAAHGMAG